jgi:hypothetical protein
MEKTQSEHERGRLDQGSPGTLAGKALRGLSRVTGGRGAARASGVLSSSDRLSRRPRGVNETARQKSIKQSTCPRGPRESHDNSQHLAVKQQTQAHHSEREGKHTRLAHAVRLRGQLSLRTSSTPRLNQCLRTLRTKNDLDVLGQPLPSRTNVPKRAAIPRAGCCRLNTIWVEEERATC